MKKLLSLSILSALPVISVISCGNVANNEGDIKPGETQPENPDANLPGENLPETPDTNKPEGNQPEESKPLDPTKPMEFNTKTDLIKYLIDKNAPAAIEDLKNVNKSIDNIEVVYESGKLLDQANDSKKLEYQIKYSYSYDPNTIKYSNHSKTYLKSAWEKEFPNGIIILDEQQN